MLVTERMDDALELCDAALDKSRAEALTAEAKKRGSVSHVRTSRLPRPAAACTPAPRRREAAARSCLRQAAMQCGHRGSDRISTGDCLVNPCRART